MVVYAGRRLPGIASRMSRNEPPPLTHRISMIWNSRLVNFGAGNQVSYRHRKHYYGYSRSSRRGSWATEKLTSLDRNGFKVPFAGDSLSMASCEWKPSINLALLNRDGC